MLVVSDLSVRYGGIEAVRGATIEVRDGSITCLIGRNGSGKSSLVESVAGLVPSMAGSVVLDDTELSGKSAAVRARAGIALVPEDRRIFGELTVEENLLLAGPRDRKAARSRLAGVLDVFPDVKALLSHGGHNISGGQQQMVAIGRGLMREPSVLILDEPSLGLAPLIVEEVFRAIEAIAEAGQSVLLIEQNARAALEVATYAYSMSLGEVDALGPTAELPADLDLQALYL